MDEQALEAWLQSHVPGFSGPLRLEKFDSGQSNPTFRIDAGSGTYVLRRKPPGELLKSAHAVDREFRVQRALADSAVPVARMHALCDDDSVIGSMFYVMDHVEGRVIFDPSMPGLSPGDRAAIMDEMNRVLAAIHDVDVDSVGLSNYGPPGDYYARQLARWTKQYRATETETLPAMNDLISWLETHLPEDDGQRCLVHGDYRIDNLLYAPDAPKIRAVLDWELSTLGHPYADLAAVIMQWQLPPGDEGRGLSGLDRAQLGLPSDADFVAQYFARRQMQPPQNFAYYVAFAFFRMAAILQGVKKRALDGNASNPDKAAKLGAYVPRFAELGLEAAHGG
ncbi:phosphotransferase family protein [Primorskyibacter aestuariivivens]|uniref:phosphotransferase family protein n=1 Tax=Primorskyibacter aestuariivivens TaxID=1888912 RepID=UPI0023010462|nr:phosphotransferase family protein [Primorskyibacter aestuariivivens]MDA7429334.1 phosphotransferase family protein [Primorskyibacter aestuariivivens]